MSSVSHTYPSVQLLASDISADYYARAPGIVNLVMLTVTYIQALAIYIYIYIYRQGRFNNHTVHSLYRIHGHGNQCHGSDENGQYCAESGTRTHISGIPGQCATIATIPDVITIHMPTCLCSSLPQRSVHTTKQLYIAFILFIHSLILFYLRNNWRNTDLTFILRLRT